MHRLRDNSPTNVTAVLSPGTVATELGLRPNQANKGQKTLIDPNYLIQSKDCGECLRFAAQNLSDRSVLSNIWLETFYHGYPVIRQSQAKYLAKL